MKLTCSVLLFLLIMSFPVTEASVPAWNPEIKFVNFKDHQEEKVREAIKLIRNVIYSQEFKDRILNHTFDGEKTFVNSLGLSNEEIYRKIIEGTMKVELELYHSATTTIGYTYPDTNRIWINTKYFNRYTAVNVADNLMHEWMHKLGFNHDMKYSKSRNYSVPYAIGYLMEELAGKIK